MSSTDCCHSANLSEKLVCECTSLSKTDFMNFLSKNSDWSNVKVINHLDIGQCPGCKENAESAMTEFKTKKNLN